jgi:hypothetical protein
MTSFLSYAARIFILTLPLAACAGDAPITYTGTLIPSAGTCDLTNRATLQRHGANLQFTPQDGVLVLDGTVSPTGTISASETTSSMDRKPYHLTFTGQVHGTSVTGTYVTPRCRYAVALTAVP